MERGFAAGFEVSLVEFAVRECQQSRVVTSLKLARFWIAKPHKCKLSHLCWVRPTECKPCSAFSNSLLRKLMNVDFGLAEVVLQS